MGAGMTQTQLGHKIGYTEKAISKWECAKAIPPTEALLILADVLGTSLDELFSYHGAPEYYLGVDGGASKTLFSLCARDGQEVRRVILESSNPVDIGFTDTCRVLEQGIRTVCEGVSYRKVSAFFGLSGGVSGDMQARIADFLENFPFAYCHNGSDSQNAVEAALQGEDGIALIGGTGIVAVSVRGKKQRLCGGYGYLLDGGGSGYDIGRDGVRAACRTEDGRERAYRLREEILRFTKKESMRAAISEIYEGGKRGISRFCPLVFRLAKEGDMPARQILRENFRAVADLIGAALVMTEPAPDECIRVRMVGGLCREREVWQPYLSEALADLGLSQRVDFDVCPKEPVSGALRLAGLSMPMHPQAILQE